MLPSQPCTVSPTLNLKWNPVSSLLAFTLGRKLVEFVSTTISELGLEIIEVLIRLDVNHTTVKDGKRQKDTHGLHAAVSVKDTRMG